MKKKDEILSMLFAKVAELESGQANEKAERMLEIQIGILYDILGDEVPEEWAEKIEEMI